MNRTLYLLGPTASGKKSVARRIAPALNAVLLSLDSVKVFQGMDRGTDKDPGRRFALTDLVAPHEEYSVGAYVESAAREVERVRQASRVPLFVGGTGLYLRALVRGLFRGPPIDPTVRERVRQRLEREGSAALHAVLEDVDPEAAGRLHPADARRVTRALEVYEQTGRPLSDWQRHDTVRAIDGPSVLVGLRRSREDLRARITERVDRMLAEGLVDEVQALREAGAIGPVAACAIGYREVLQHLDGEFDGATCRSRIIDHTWQFSRRQENWFKQFPETYWVNATGRSMEDVSNEVAQAFTSD